MGKKSKRNVRNVVKLEEIQDQVSENSVDNGENIENSENDCPEEWTAIFNSTEEDLSGYTVLADKLLNEALSSPVGEERTKSIQDWNLVTKVIREGYTNQNEAEKLKLEVEQKRTQFEREILIKQKEIEIKEREIALKEFEQQARVIDQSLREEEIKTSKRGIVVNAITTFLTMAGSMFGYGLLLSRQNEFEREDPYTTQGSKNLMSNISRLPRLKG